MDRVRSFATELLKDLGCDQIARLYPQIPVVLATGYSDEVTEKRPDLPVLLKPYATSDVSQALSKALASAASVTKRSNSL